MTTELTKYSLKSPSDNGQIDDLLKGKKDQESRQRLQALNHSMSFESPL